MVVVEADRGSNAVTQQVKKKRENGGRAGIPVPMDAYHEK